MTKWDQSLACCVWGQPQQFTGRVIVSHRHPDRKDDGSSTPQRAGVYRFVPCKTNLQNHALVDVAGTGTTVESVRHCIYSLRHLLSPNYAVIPISESVILNEPWGPTCALLVIPGGADLGYCRVLNGEGNRRILDFVRRGGAYLGLCAGGYYGSRRCEFEVGNKPLEVIGSRELGLFQGTCRGAAFKGFDYHTEKGARAVRLRVNKNAFQEDVAEEVYSYFNGGGVFVDADNLKTGKTEVLANYADDLDIDGGAGAAAVVYTALGEGKAIVTGPHPE